MSLHNGKANNTQMTDRIFCLKHNITKMDMDNMVHEDVRAWQWIMRQETKKEKK